MKEADFVLDKIDGDGYNYWFRVVGETKNELTQKYMEPSMIEVSGAMFSLLSGQWGIKRRFPSNCDVITPKDDKELYDILQNVARKIHNFMPDGDSRSWDPERIRMHLAKNISPALYRAKDVSTHQWVYGYYIDKVTGAVPIIITEAEMDDRGTVDFEYHFVDAATVEVVR